MQAVLQDDRCTTDLQLPTALLAAGVPLMLPPQSVAIQMLQYMQPSPSKVTPALARSALCTRSSSHWEDGKLGSSAATAETPSLSVKHVPPLLEYCMSDLVLQGLLPGVPNQAGGRGQSVGVDGLGPNARQQQATAARHAGKMRVWICPICCCFAFQALKIYAQVMWLISDILC